MSVVYETEPPFALRTELGSLPEAEVYRSPAIAELELDLERFWRSVED